MISAVKLSALVFLGTLIAVHSAFAEFVIYEDRKEAFIKGPLVKKILTCEIDSFEQNGKKFKILRDNTCRIHDDTMAKKAGDIKEIYGTFHDGKYNFQIETSFELDKNSGYYIGNYNFSIEEEK